jgi:single-stranded DNA-binding protein
LAKLIETNIKVGQEVDVEGKLDNNSYKDRYGNMIYENQIIISKITIVEEYNIKELIP